MNRYKTIIISFLSLLCIAPGAIGIEPARLESGFAMRHPMFGGELLTGHYYLLAPSFMLKSSRMVDQGLVFYDASFQTGAGLYYLKTNRKMADMSYLPAPICVKYEGIRTFPSGDSLKAFTEVACSSFAQKTASIKPATSNTCPIKHKAIPEYSAIPKNEWECGLNFSPSTIDKYFPTARWEPVKFDGGTMFIDKQSQRRAIVPANDSAISPYQYQFQMVADGDILHRYPLNALLDCQNKTIKIQFPTKQNTETVPVSGANPIFKHFCSVSQ